LLPAERTTRQAHGAGAAFDFTGRDSPRVNRPLQGMQVFEFASFVAGPTAGMTLAQLGADVIRIDPIQGNSDYRRWPIAPNGDSFFWTSLNKGKRSVAIDIKQPVGRELLLALVTAPGEDRGILVDNSVGRAWLDHAELTARRADLIHARLQGYPDGRPSVDYTINPEVGVPFITGPELGGPVNHVVPAWDLVTATTLTTAILAALLDRRAHGRGAYIELALSDVAAAAVANMGWLSEVVSRGSNRPRHGNYMFGSFGVDFACSDGERVMVVALTEGQWDALRRVTGTEGVFAALERALDADLTLESERYRLRETIAAVLRPWFLARTAEDVSAQLNAARVLWGRYQQMTDVVRQFQAGEWDVLADSKIPADETPTITARSPIRYDGSRGEVGAPPTLGRESAEVLLEVLRLSDADLGRLVADGVIPA
jgi:2-methylfumaryl-CoA isomerase